MVEADADMRERLKVATDVLNGRSVMYRMHVQTEGDERVDVNGYDEAVTMVSSTFSSHRVFFRGVPLEELDLTMRGQT